MVSILALVHIILSIFLVILVLVQDPKGGAAGGMFGGGGGSNSLFGATGAPSFLARVTRWVAVVFAASCIAMTIFIKPSGDSVLDSVDMPAGASQPAEAVETAPIQPEDMEPSTDAETLDEQPESN